MFSKSQSFLILSFFLLFPLINVFAIDFDSDGLDDFILVDINEKGRLEWFALDTNDGQRRSLGLFGKVGDHLAVGNWSGDGGSSKGFIRKNDNGTFDWTIDLPSGRRGLGFGSYPDLVVSGMDADGNAALDPATITKSKGKLRWKVLLNPGTGDTGDLIETTFGTKKDLPFFANLDGKGDQIGIARVDKRGVLIVKFRRVLSGKKKTLRYKKFNSKLFKILPARQKNGKDILYAVSKRGKRFRVTVLKRNRKLRTLRVTGDEVVVGSYFEPGQEVLLVRNATERSFLVNQNGKKSEVSLTLDGILVDEINVNTFEESSKPGEINPAPTPEPQRGKNPSCTGGTHPSTDHLLYKPVSDTTGNVVLVFDSKYKQAFESVQIQLRDGSYTDAWWKGLELWGNPDSGGERQHWRTNVRASEVRNNALILIEDKSQKCRFALPGSSTKRWE